MRESGKTNIENLHKKYWHLIATYLLQYFRQTILVALMGLVWLLNTGIVGRQIVGNPYVGCVSPVPHDWGAMKWIYFATAGFWWTSILIVAFGFLSGSIMSRSRAVYAVLIFASPALALLIMEFGRYFLESLRHFLISLVLYGVPILVVGVFFLTGFVTRHKYAQRLGRAN